MPAALYKALGGFATNGVNMTKLESYMVDGNFFATQFYADVDGHPDDRGLAFALEELKFFSPRIPHCRRLSRPSVPGDVHGNAGVRSLYRSDTGISRTAPRAALVVSAA